MKFFVVFAVVVSAVFGHQDHDHSHDHDHKHTVVTSKRAIAHLVGKGIEGNITFTEKDGGKVHVTGTITGLPPGHYGFHIYEYGDLTQGCNNLGDHFNPEHKEHGHPDDDNRHVGDLGNAVFDEKHESNIDILDSHIALSGCHDIVGRTLVVHEMADDFGKTEHPHSKVTGNTGGRLACGIIGRLWVDECPK